MKTPDWTLSVENYGCIEQARVTLAPLVVFVGKNNTGKSYLASLIWAIFNEDFAFIGQDEPVRVASNEKCYDILQAIAAGKIISLNGEDHVHFVNYFNEFLQEKLPNIVAYLAGNTSIDHPGLKVNAYFDEISQQKDLKFSFGLQRAVMEQLNFSRPDELINENLAVAYLSEIFRSMTGSIRRCIYVPASRTGLMLSYPYLTSSFYKSMFFGERSMRPTFPRQVAEFLGLQSDLAALDDGKNDIVEIAADIETNVLRGRIEYSNDVARNMLYMPAGSDIRLPLAAASSLVTELAPVVQIIKKSKSGLILVFEEPEAHLHLEAQRQLARALVRLVNAGVQVILTTHSDTFLQQINILMHLHGHARRDEMVQELGYRPDELIDPQKVRGYLFDDASGKTIVRELKRERRQFVEPMMNETIFGLTKEVMRLDETDEDGDDE